MDNLSQNNEKKKPKVIINKKSENSKKELNSNEKIINKGTGAGGKKTNTNGLGFEKINDISTEYNIIENNSNHKIINFKNQENFNIITGTKSQFVKYLEPYENDFFKDKRLGGTIQPDQWFIFNNTIIILELKFQQSSGSVSEKLQTPTKKIQHLQDRYPDKKIVYIYGLHKWYKKFKAELYYLKKDNIPIFWGDSETFKKDIIDYIINCIQ